MTPAQAAALQALVACGGDYGTAAALLRRSPPCLRRLVRRGAARLGARSVAHAVVLAWRAGLVVVAVADAPLVCRPARRVCWGEMRR